MNGAIPAQKKDLNLIILRTNGINVRSTLCAFYGQLIITRKPIPSTSSHGHVKSRDCST